MKCLLGISNFFEEISSLFHSIFFPIFLCFNGCGTIQILLFPLWSVRTNILHQPVSSSVTYDWFQFINEVSKKNKTKQNKTKQKLQEFINTVFHGCHWIRVLLHLLQINIVVYHHPLLQYTDMLQVLYFNLGAKFLVVIKSQCFSFGAWPNGFFILTNKPNCSVYILWHA